MPQPRTKLGHRKLHAKMQCPSLELSWASQIACRTEHHDTTFNSCSHFQTVIKLVVVESLWWWLLCRKLVLHTMSYRKAHMRPPKPKADRQYLRAPPPTPPEFDPQAREPDDNTIDELPEHPMLMRALTMLCVFSICHRNQCHHPTGTRCL